MSRTALFYGLATCDTCRKAKKYLLEQNVLLTEYPIRTSPPAAADLKRWMEAGLNQGEKLTRFLNTSSDDYRQLGIAPGTLTLERALELIQLTPNLLKRPIIVVGENAVFGFKIEALDALIA